MPGARAIITLALACLACLPPLTATAADTIRLATYNASLSRNGPGVLLLDLRKGDNPQINAVADILRRVRPDILLINEFDYDPEALAARQFIDLLATPGATGDGLEYPHHFASPPNTGMPSGLDLDGDGKLNGPADAFGFGNFPGQYGMLLLSRYPIATGEARTFANLLWRDLPDARLPFDATGVAFPSPAAHAALRLSSKSHWDVPVDTPAGRIHILASHPTPPVFDGPEDMNGLRNGDEIRFWRLYLDGTEFTDDAGNAEAFRGQNFAVMGDLNADPVDGEGAHAILADLIAHPQVQDPEPASAGGTAAAHRQAGANDRHRGNPALDTADWRDDREPGNLRVDYVLPSRNLDITGAGVFWPAPGAPGHEILAAGGKPTSDHHLVWVDIALPRQP